MLHLPQCMHLEVNHLKPLATLYTQLLLDLMTFLEQQLQKGKAARVITDGLSIQSLTVVMTTVVGGRVIVKCPS